jgi:aminoglycoside 6'-N-acetyltransferase-1b
MLHEWLSRPHVAERWQPTPTLAELREDYFPVSTTSPGDRHYIATMDGKPIGFIQSYVPAEAHGEWWPDEDDPTVRGIDQFLADGAGLGKGLGTAMVKAFIEHLFSDPTVTRIQTDPSPDNARAIRCYEKAGFRRVRELDTPDGRELLMYCDRVVESVSR